MVAVVVGGFFLIVLEAEGSVFVVVMTRGGKSLAKPAADVREEKSRRWVAEWKV